MTAGAGAEYDSNVAISEIDATSGESDYAALLDFKLGLKQPLSATSALSLNYDFNQSRYRDFSEVDRQTHILGADVRWDLGKSNASFSAYYVHSRLDNRPFLDFLRLSPSVSGFISKRWFARGAYVYSERTLDNRPTRDAATHAVEGDLYYFHRGLRSYFNVGYRYRDENAVDDQLSFTSHGLKLRYIRRFPLWGMQAKGELSWRYETRDFRELTTEISAIRQDDRSRVKADVELPLSSQLSWTLYTSYGDYSSNLERVDFNQTVVGTRLAYTW